MLSRLTEQMVRQAERRFPANAWKPCELRCQVFYGRHDRESGSEWELEGQVHSPCQLAHLFLREIGRLLLCFDDRDEDQVLEHLDVGRVHDRRVDLDLADLPFAIGLDRHHPAAGGGVDRSSLELVLDLLQSTLHLLRLLQDLHDIGHRYQRVAGGGRKATRRSQRGASGQEGPHKRTMRWKNQSSSSRSSASIAAPRTGSRFRSDVMRCCRISSSVTRLWEPDTDGPLGRAMMTRSTAGKIPFTTASMSVFAISSASAAASSSACTVSDPVDEIADGVACSRNGARSIRLARSEA